MSLADRLSTCELQTLELQLVDSALIVSVHQPETLNALSPAVISDLRTVFGELRHLGEPDGDATAQTAHGEIDWSIRGVILTGAGGRAFVAGADISALTQMDSASVHNYAGEVHELFSWIETLPVPVIAAVNGYALGGGCELALACDMVYSTEHAKFGQPEVALGIIPGFGGCVRLQRLVGPAVAREMIYTGRHIESNEALAIGLVSRVLPDNGALMDAAHQTLQQVARQSPAAVATAKRTINHVRTLPIDEGLKFELDAFASRFGSPDMLEGTAAFLAKRPADFTGQ